MYNWSTDTTKLKRDKKKYAVWKLEQMINFGLQGKKISAKTLRTYWHDITIDPARRKLLSILLHDRDKKDSH